MNGRQADAIARQRAQEVFDRPLVLEAGAGTGKTATLVARVLAWALQWGWEKARGTLQDQEKDTNPESIAARVMERIVAITFTERAAAEMAARIATGLDELRQGTKPVGFDLDALQIDPKEVPLRATALLSAIDRIKVTTINAYCQSILTSHPLEAGLHPGFQVDADGRKTREKVDQLLTTYLADNLEALPEDLKTILHEEIGLHEIRAILHKLAVEAANPEDFPEEPYPKEKAAVLVDALRGHLDTLVRLLDAPLNAGKGNLKAAKRAVEHFGDWSHALSKEWSVESLPELFQDPVLEKTLKERLKPWGNGSFNKTETTALSEDCREAVRQAASPAAEIALAIHAWKPALLRAMVSVIRPLLATIRESLRRSGIIHFSEQLRNARNLLVSHPHIASIERSNMDLLLVDEFQDTNPTQCDVVRALALTGPKAERPSLFLVGDPKQSIYGWREADLSAFSSFVQEILDAGGIRDLLAINYRSVPAILDEVERVTSTLMTQTPNLSPQFQPLFPCRANETATGFNHGTWTPVEYWPSWGLDDGGLPNPKQKFTKAGPARELESKAIARDLLRLRKDHGLSWGSAAILMRATTSLELYLGPLREAGIPFVVERDRSYYQRREVIDAISLFRVIADPNDHVALVGLLRAPFVGVPDAAIAPLWAEQLPTLLHHTQNEDWEERLVGAIDRAAAATPRTDGQQRIPNWTAVLKFTLCQIAKLRRAYCSDSVEVFMDQLRDSLLQEVTEAARFLGAHRLANLARFERALVALMENPDLSAGEILSDLRGGVFERRQEQEGVPGDEAMDAVRILTFHKAKGLTFDHVYLIDLSWTKGSHKGKDTMVGQWQGQPEYILHGLPSIGWFQLARKKEETLAGERIRELYVAMTRPKVRLVLLGIFPEAGTIVPPNEAGNYVQLLAHRFEKGHQLKSSPQTEHVDTFGARWYYPALATKGAGISLSTGSPPVRTPATQQQKDGETLEAHKTNAEATMARPSLLPASAVGKPHLPVGGGSASSSPSYAGVLGTALHQVFEDLETKSPYHAKDHEGPLRSRLAQEIPEPEVDAVFQDGLRILEELEGSETMRRFFQVNIVARELPVLVKTQVDGKEQTVTGSIDLLYTDPDTGKWIIADYKTDRVHTNEEMAERVERYRGQGRVYKEAVQAALSLDEAPVFELWFLRKDAIVEVY